METSSLLFLSLLFFNMKCFKKSLLKRKVKAQKNYSDMKRENRIDTFVIVESLVNSSVLLVFN